MYVDDSDGSRDQKRRLTRRQATEPRRRRRKWKTYVTRRASKSSSTAHFRAKRHELAGSGKRATSVRHTLRTSSSHQTIIVVQHTPAAEQPLSSGVQKCPATSEHYSTPSSTLVGLRWGDRVPSGVYVHSEILQCLTTVLLLSRRDNHGQQIKSVFAPVLLSYFKCYKPFSRRLCLAILCKHDVIRNFSKTESTPQHIVKPPEEDRATVTGDVKIQ